MEDTTAQPFEMQSAEQAPPVNVRANPPHSKTQSTLAPTSEFTRNFLLALPARYVFRAAFGPSISGRLSNNVALGLGSTALSTSYSHTVYKDMFNLFSETVAYESGKDPSQVTFNDIRHSDNRIVSRTVNNWYYKTASRLATDALFFAAPLLHLSSKTHGWMHKNDWIVRMGDGALGIKGAQLFAETWNRNPTLFEHISALINSKINPKNGLGQPINSGEVFDLYQHYHFQFTPEKAFTNVLDNDPEEARTWAVGKPVFDRITELLNLTYSYKHATNLNDVGQPLREANFTLPKFLYLLGHDMIDPTSPAKTLTYIEIANTHGMEALKDARSKLDAGASLNDITTLYPVTIKLNHQPKRELVPVSTRKGTKPTADSIEPIPTTLLANAERTHEGPLTETALAR